MPSIKQIIAEIQLAQTLGPNQKQFVVNAIRDAEERLKLRAPRAPRKIVGAKGLVTLEQWESQHGQLTTCHVAKWSEKELKLDGTIIGTLIDEFRADMLSKGKQYANFALAFQTYLRRGYLSKTLEQCKFRGNTVIEKRGINL